LFGSFPAITGYGIITALAADSNATGHILFNNTQYEHPSSVMTELRIPERWTQHHREAFRPNSFAWQAIEEALQMAGLTSAELFSKRVGVCIGSTSGGANYQAEFNSQFHLGLTPDPRSLLEYFSTNTAQWIARRLKLSGPVLLINNACTSGADAVGIAAQWLRADLCDLVICGGTETIYPFIQAGFRSLMLTSNEACKPFDRSRNGLNLGEGSGILILEKPSTPRPKRARLLGYGSASDAYHPTTPHPEGRGLSQAVGRALRGFKSVSIDFVNAHGTGTLHNDAVEGKWIAAHLPNTTLVATKGYTGHTLGAAGAVEAILSVMSLERQMLPRSIGFSQMDPDIGITPTDQLISNEYRAALSFSLGFGGTNSVLCLARESSGVYT
jgi:3-oxoacyl-[acyl-carrier-protein] synthase-1/3-oxoacyl-[acyl-carrier-protein] synthase II